MAGVFDLAMATLRVDRDPVYPVRRALPPNKTQHKRALDLDAAFWRIPSERMKQRKPHATPAASGGLAIVQVEDYMKVTSELAQTTPRATRGKRELDQLPAERKRRAKAIHAEGELQVQAAEKSLEAAQTLGQAPQSMQLRYLQTLTAIGGEKPST